MNEEERQEKRVTPSKGCNCSSGAGSAEPEISRAVQNLQDEGYDNEKLDHDDHTAARKKAVVAVKDIKSARPDLRAIIDQEIAEASGSRLAIVACGPDSFMRDVQDHVARLQMDILKGRSKVNEVYLRSEAFHW